jgi:hypothetical protein
VNRNWALERSADISIDIERSTSRGRQIGIFRCRDETDRGEIARGAPRLGVMSERALQEYARISSANFHRVAD